MNKVEDMLNELIKKEEKRNVIVWIMAIIGVLAAIAAVVVAICHFLKKKEMEEFVDEFDEEFDDDFFDEDDEEICDCGECACDCGCEEAEEAVEEEA